MSILEQCLATLMKKKSIMNNWCSIFFSLNKRGVNVVGMMNLLCECGVRATRHM